MKRKQPSYLHVVLLNIG